MPAETMTGPRVDTPDLPDFPRHWHFACALVAACRRTDEDPEAVAQGSTPSRGRAYAYWSLRQLFPRTPGTYLVLGLGNRVKRHPKMFAALERRWWRPELVDEIADLVQAQPPIEHSVPASDEPVHLRMTVPDILVATRRRIIDRRPAGNITADLLGDPPPGRSALDQRRSFS